MIAPNQKNATVSVVVINHNYGKYLKFAIDSVLAQGSPAAEIVVVDDGSTDDSRDIILSYGDAILPVFKSAGGHVSAVNAGYAATTGELSIFLDADDMLYADCIESVQSAWRPGDVKLQYRLDTIDADGVNQNMPFPYFAANLDPEEVRRQSFRYGVYPWTVSSGNAFSRSLLDCLLPIDAVEIYRSPDGYINKMAPLFGDVRSLDRVLGAYRVHGSNAWAQDGAQIRLEPIVRWLKFDQVLHRRFEREATRRNIAVVAIERTRSVQQAEYQLLARRLGGPEESEGASRWALLMRGSRAVLEAANTSAFGRLIWIAWLFVMAYGPRAVVNAIFKTARGQAGRDVASRVLIWMSRGRAR